MLLRLLLILYLHGQSLAKPLTISGWPVVDFDRSQPSAGLGQDPVIGRLTCPPFSWLKKQKSESLFFSQVTVSANRLEWNYEIRGGLYWWDGKRVDPKGVAEFFRRELPKIVKERSVGLWRIPKYELKVNSGRTLRVLWQQVPVFGPYVFNGVAFYKPQQQRFICAGLYRPKPGQKHLSLLPNSHYQQGLRPLTFLDSGGTWEFRSAKNYTLRQFLTETKCKWRVDLPYASALLWQATGSLWQRLPPKLGRQLRLLLAKSLPTQTAIRACGGLARPLNTLVPQRHPGFSRKRKSLKIVQILPQLAQLGFKRSPRGLWQWRGQDLVFKLKLQHNNEILIKLISDLFITLGFQVRFVETGEDGLLAGLRLPLPELNYLPLIHSKLKTDFIKIHNDNSKLDLSLESYARSLTMKYPNFRSLKNIQADLASQAWVWGLLQHQMCFRVKVDYLDPNWFRALLR